MSCERCGGLMYRDEYDDPSCLICGNIAYAKADVEAAVQLHAEMPKGARRATERRSYAQQMEDRRQRIRRNYEQRKAAARA